MEHQYIDDILKKDTYAGLDENYFLNKTLYVRSVENGYILPSKGWMNSKLSGGIVTNDKKYVKGSGFVDSVSCSYDFDEGECEKLDKTVIYLGLFLPVWGHILTDCLKKMWFLESKECKQLLKDGAQLVYIKTVDALPTSFFELLSVLGIETASLCEVHSITQFTKIIIPDNALDRLDDNMNILYYTKEYEDTIDRVKRNTEVVSVPKYEKIYFSRSGLNGSRDYGEKRVEDVFKYLGYKIIYPERLSFKEQFSLLRQCVCFAATEGSTSHNSIFCQNGTSVTILRKSAYINEYQLMINQLNNLNVTYVDSHLSICIDKDKPWYGPFFMYVNNNLLDYAHIPRVFNNFSLSNFKEYAKRGYALYHKKLPYSEYYTARLLEEMNMSFFCKNWLKRCVRFIFSHGNLSILVPLYKRMTSRG